MFICGCLVHLRARVRLVLNGEEGDGLAGLASSAGSSNTVNIVFDGQGELLMLANAQM
jgi:hypothetical protein